MGRDRIWQAIPDDWEPFRLACEGIRYHDMIHWTYLAIQNPQRVYQSTVGLRLGRDKARQDYEREFLEEVELLRRNNPGIDRRAYDEAYRASSSVKWVLEKYVECHDGLTEDAKDKIVEKAMDGSRHLWFDVDFRYSPPIDVLEVALLLEPITWSELKTHFQPEQMCHVYKFNPNLPESWYQIWQVFERIRAVFLAAAEVEEGMLISFR
jgi:hypothetical protein